MKKRTHARAYPLGLENNSGGMVLYLGISLLIHLIFIGSMVFMPESAPRSRFSPGAINVSLVSLPGPPASAPAPAAQSAVVQKQEIKPAPKAPEVEISPPKPLPVIEEPDKTVSLAPKPKKAVSPPPKPKKVVSTAPKPEKKKVKKSLKKKTQDRQKMIKQAVSKVQKDVENSRSDSVRQAIDRLKKKVAKTEASGTPVGPVTGTAAGSVGSGVPGAAGSGGTRAVEIIDLYKIEVAFQVERHWAFSEQLGGSGGAQQVSLVFKVLPSGEITDIRFTERSGNSYLDESAYKAVVKANPVSPHPEGIRAPYVMVALRFTPEGMRK
jgi:colicin import membrane protein